VGLQRLVHLLEEATGEGGVMCEYPGKLSLSRLASSFLLAFFLSLVAVPLASEEVQKEATISVIELQRLKAISERLQAISVEQRLQLGTSRKQIANLLNELAGLKSELSALRKELSELKDESRALRQSAETSADLSISLQAEVTRLASLASSLEDSFKKYRAAAEAEIARLERKSKILGWVATGASALAIGGWAALAACW
jgi:DNA repair exonuclease SbcCD ATPase subunit